MIVNVEHSTLGTITIEESFWTGKKKITINDKQLSKVDKKSFETEEGEHVSIEGSLVFGAKLVYKDEKIQVTEKLKWWEIVLALLPFIFDMVWGNSVSLVTIFPVVAGAIGGLVTGLIGFTILYINKVYVKEWWLKIIVGIGFFIASIFICWLLALVFIAAF